MARIFITGSTDGLGFLAAHQLIAKGHEVVFHARNHERAKETSTRIPKNARILVADLASLDACRNLADEVRALGPLDVLLHNAGVYRAPDREIFAVNVLAPYVLTALIPPPDRLISMSSALHYQGTLSFSALEDRRLGYADSKAFLTLFALAVARKWPRVRSNAVDPGWVPTKMGGAGAPDDLQMGVETQVWLASDQQIQRTGGYYHHRKEQTPLPGTDDRELQDRFLDVCQRITGIAFPDPA